jgi:hypothetical protein
MRMPRQAPAAVTGRLVFQLKAQGEEKGEDTFEERLAIAKQLEVRRFALEIDSDGAVFSRRFRCCAHVLPLCHQSRKLRRHSGGNALQSQAHCEGLRRLPLKAMECGIRRWLQVIRKERPAPLSHAPFSMPWARKRCSVDPRFRQY